MLCPSPKALALKFHSTKDFSGTLLHAVTVPGELPVP